MTTVDMNQKTLDKLLQSYHKLPSAEQRILQVLAVIYQPIKQTDLQRLLRNLDYKDHRGKAIAPLMAKPLREKLLRKKVLQLQSGRLVCQPLLVEILAGIAVENNIYAEVAEQADCFMPLSNYQYRPQPPMERGRQLRHAFYQQQYVQVFTLLEISKPFEETDNSKSNELIKICMTPMIPTRFDALPVDIKFQVLAPLLRSSAEGLQVGQSYFSLLERQIDEGLVPASGPMALLLAEQKLMRGQLEGVEALLLPQPSYQSLALLAWLRCLQGQYETAIELFEQALTVKRKGSRKRNIMLTGLPGIFYLLALLRTEQKSSLVQAEKLLKMQEKNAEKDAWAVAFPPLTALVSILKGEGKFEYSYSLQGHQRWNISPWELLFRCLATHWLGEKVSPEDQAALAEFSDQAHQAGLQWYATESVLMLSWLGANQKGAKKQGSDALVDAKSMQFQSIGQLLQPTPAWQRSLSALRDVHEETAVSPNTPPSAKALRMIWWLKDDLVGEYSLQPREQKLKKNGQWSKGRSVSLKRLYSDLDEFDYLTAEDRLICQTIRSTDHWDYYGSPSYEFSGNSSLLAAVGHPDIYWAHAPNSAVELLKAEPELTVLQQKTQLKLQLTPFPGESIDFNPCVAIKDGPSRLRLVTFDPEHLRIADILGPKGLKVPLQAKEQVLESIAAIAPILTVHSDIGGVEGIDTGATKIEADHRLHLHLQPAGEGLRIEWYVSPFAAAVNPDPALESPSKGESLPEGERLPETERLAEGPLFRPGEGGSTVFAEIAGQRLLTSRDHDQERAALQTLIDHCGLPVSDSEHDCVLEDPEFSLEVLLQLQGMAEQVVLSWPRGQAIKLASERDTNHMQLAVRQQRDWFSLEGELSLDNGDVLSMQQLLGLLQQSPGRFIRMADGEFLALTQTLRKRLDRLAASSDDGRFHPLASHVLEEVSEGMKLKSCKAWNQQLKRLQSARDFQPVLPSTLQVELRDYQLEGYNWLARLAHWGAGACLADDMGLGKTLQALAVIVARAADGPTLVLAPTSVCMNWLEEAQRFAPTLNVLRFGEGDRQTMLDNLGAFDLLVCSYGLLQSEASRLTAVQWHTIVADEAQAIKNAATKRSKAVMALQGDFKIITTGTPIENHLGELWNLFRFINPGLLGSLEQFNQRFASPIENDHNLLAKQQLRQLIRPFILRRLKTDVLTELPAKTEITLHVELSEEENVFYEALRRKAVESLTQSDDNPGQQRMKIFAEIMRLRRACCHPKLVLADSDIASAKLKAFARVLDELIENRHKALVFSQFVGHLELIRQHLDKHNIAYQYLDGSTPMKKRQQAVTAFQRGEGEVFLISLKAGGSGLNLTAADYVIHMDPWWNPAVEDQASDRAHRMGQQRPVTIYRMVTKNTIEEKIVSLHAQKRDLANSLLEGSEMSGKMSMDDMFNLLKDD